MQFLQDSLTKKIRRALLPLALLLTAQAQAGLIVDEGLLDIDILGGQLLVVDTGTVTATFLGSDAGYFNTLFLATPNSGTPTAIFNKNTSAGSTANLGSFDAGTELIFRLFVRNTGNNFYTGDINRNPDQLAHAKATTSLVNGGYITRVGFEDLWGGGDEDYNDFEFLLSNVVDPPSPPTQVSEPPLLPLVALGMLGVYWKRRKVA
ncbi:DUF4114 domain-containing protein [Halieaceae bacterium IMCC14734]|uniref:DUF4114 domain-containing protein n=1 Tax=Candidatus Litorirhabdus singularis TaxID=2518993 RepID=A0ABT3TBH9_9GAMM|nr:DUF4114 domain-containing protein [Candidatus Litorirhabdus singularis]MCX2979643.1 DUF4114 domain-containing protein [Candidatus Litorirhabdus singularis]